MNTGTIIRADELANGDKVRFPGGETGHYWVEVGRVHNTGDSLEVLFVVNHNETIYKTMVCDQNVMRMDEES